MEPLREARLQKERTDEVMNRCRDLLTRYRSWHFKQDDRQVMQPVMDILSRPDVLELLGDATKTRKDLMAHPFEDSFPTFVAEWRKKRDGELRKIVRDSDTFKDKIPEDVDPLSLASVMFSCSRCTAEKTVHRTLPPAYPRILSHRCLHCKLSTVAREVGQVVQWLLSKRGEGGVSPVDLAYSLHMDDFLSVGVWHRRAADIIKACGQDPMTVTRDKMDMLDVRVYCEGCDQDSASYRRVFRWRDAVSYLARLHCVES